MSTDGKRATSAGENDNNGDEEEAEEAEATSLSESGSDNDDEQSSEEEESTPPPPIELPNRTTRGKRLRQQVDDEEEDADNQFWQQDFFAEEGQDAEYSADSDSQDSGDSDFSDPEEEDKEEDNAGEEALKSVLKLKKPKDKPPGYKQAQLRKAAQARAKHKRELKALGDDSAQPAKKKKEGGKRVRFTEPTEAPSAPVLRWSTYARVQQDELERSATAQRKPTSSRSKPKEPLPSLYMVDVLQRAAADQLANQASLQQLIAREADLKAKANQTRPASQGPRVRWRFFKDFVPDPGGGEQPQAPSTSTSEAATAKGHGVPVGRCTAEFIDMKPEMVPDEFHPKSAASIFRPPSNVCVRADGSMQQRVRRLTPDSGAQPSASWAAGLGGNTTDGACELSERAIKARVQRHYGDMSRLMEAVDGCQGVAPAAAAQIEALSNMPGGLQGTEMQLQGAVSVAAGQSTGMLLAGPAAGVLGMSAGLGVDMTGDAAPAVLGGLDASFPGGQPWPSLDPHASRPASKSIGEALGGSLEASGAGRQGGRGGKAGRGGQDGKGGRGGRVGNNSSAGAASTPDQGVHAAAGAGAVASPLQSAHTSPFPTTHAASAPASLAAAHAPHSHGGPMAQQSGLHDVYGGAQRSSAPLGVAPQPQPPGGVADQNMRNVVGTSQLATVGPPGAIDVSAARLSHPLPVPSQAIPLGASLAGSLAQLGQLSDPSALGTGQFAHLQQLGGVGQIPPVLPGAAPPVCPPPNGAVVHPGFGPTTAAASALHGVYGAKVDPVTPGGQPVGIPDSVPAVPCVPAVAKNGHGQHVPIVGADGTAALGNPGWGVQQNLAGFPLSHNGLGLQWPAPGAGR